MKREDRLDILIDGLRKESYEYTQLSIPDNVTDKQKLLRAMMNVRLPKPIDDEWIRLQNLELSEQLLEKGGIVDIYSLPRRH